MQKLGLQQSLLQKLSPQQIQFIKLLQIPTMELDARIKEEMEENPALEEGKDEWDESSENTEGSDEDTATQEEDNALADRDDLSLDEYLQDDYSGYKMQGDGGGEEEEREMPVVRMESLLESLLTQVGFLRLNEREETIARQLIGSLDDDGYLRRDLESIANDLAFSQNIETDEDELESILYKIQDFDPAGIGARTLQECLLLQLRRRAHNPDTDHAIAILHDYYEEFTRKHYEKIQKRLGLDDEAFRAAIRIITRLNPRPGGDDNGMTRAQVIIPDFILRNQNGQLELSLNSRNAPELRVSASYREMFEAYEKSTRKDSEMKKTVTFVKQKLDAARWFIDAIRQRQQTLMLTMQAIVEAQRAFFLDGDESQLRPMILKDIADAIHMDISTVSRIASSKYIQTDFGVYPIKYFFSEGIAMEGGEDVSNREVKALLKEMIDAEDKRKPLSDEKLEKLLKIKGYVIARRTVAKYREQLNIPVARLRKEV